MKITEDVLVVNQYTAISIAVLAVFIMLAMMVSPKVNLGLLNLPLIKEDIAIFLQVNKLHYAPLNQFMVLMTQYGRELIWSMVIVVLFIFGGSRGKKTAAIMALAMIVLIPIGIVSKEIVARPRPFIPKADFILAADSQNAYPSGHATIVSAGVVILLTLYSNKNNNNSSSKKKVLSIVLLIEAAIVCFSRVYVGGHYPLDVVGGILLGAGISFLFVGQIRRIQDLYAMASKPFR
jgi:membrane-associated phospholipid phosphatase